MVAKSAKSMPHMSGPSRLLGHEVGNHLRGRFENGLGVAEFGMLATKVGLHFHVASSGFIGRMKRHSNGALVVAKKTRGLRKTKTEIAKEHANVENLFDTLRLSAIFGLLGGEAHRRAELDPPANASAIEKNDMSTGRAAIVEIGTPIAPEYADRMGNVRTTPDGKVDELAMSRPDFLAEC